MIITTIYKHVGGYIEDFFTGKFETIEDAHLWCVEESSDEVVYILDDEFATIH